MKGMKNVIGIAVFGLFVSSAVHCAQNYFEVGVTNKTGDIIIAMSELGGKKQHISNNEEGFFKLW